MVLSFTFDKMASIQKENAQKQLYELGNFEVNESDVNDNRREDALLNSKTNRQLRQLSLNFDIDGANATINSPNHDKATKYKGRKNREMDSLEENQIIAARLRSNSGKLYTSSVSVEASGTTNNLETVVEEDLQVSESDEPETELINMCPKEECCQGTNTVISMISKLQKSIDGVLKKVSQQEIVSSNASHRIDDLEEQVTQNGNEIDDVNKELQETKFQLRVVTDIVIKQDEQIGFLKQKINEIQKREMSPNVIVSGILESKNEKPMILFNDFVQKGLEIQELIPANRAFRIGSGRNRPLLVELRHTESKNKLFANATKLRGKVNQNGKPYFLSEHLPEELNEDRRRSNAIFAENKKKPSSH